MSTIQDPLAEASEVMLRSRGIVDRTTDVERRAAEMRVMGMSYAEITETLGFVDMAAVASIVHETATNSLRDEVPDMRRLTLLRLDRMLKVIMPWALGEGRDFPVEDDDGNTEWVGVPALAAIETVLKLEAFKAKLVGMNAPEEVRIGPAKVSGADRVVDDVGRFTTIVEGLVVDRSIADRRHPEESDIIDVEAVEDEGSETGDV